MAETRTVVDGTEEASGDKSASRDLARNIGAFAVAQFSVRIVGLGVVVVVARVLSNEDFGRYSVALALSAMLTLVVESGMGGYLVREGSQAPQRMGVALGHVLVLQASLGILALAACAVIATALGYDPTTMVSTLLLAVSAVATIMQRSLMAVLNSINRARTSAAFQTGQALIIAVLTILAGISGTGPVGISAAILAGTLISFPVAWLMLRRHWRMPVRFEREGIWDTFSVSAAYSAAKLGGSVLTYIDAVMVQAIKGNIAAAQYGASYRLLLALRMFPLIYTDALAQPAARLAKTDRRALTEMVNRATSQLLILGLPIGIGGLLLAKPIMSTIFGESYAAASGAAGLLFLGMVLSFPGQISVIVALAVGRERLVARAFGATALVNVAINAVLIPKYGPKGAAVAMLVSNVVLYGSTFAILWREGIRISVWSRLLKSAAAVAAMSAVVIVAGALPLFAVIGLAAAVYLGLIVLLRTFDAEDIRMLPMGRRLSWLGST